MSDELIILAKEVERSRKSSRELGVRLEKNLAEQEYLVDKVSHITTACTRLSSRSSLEIDVGSTTP